MPAWYALQADGVLVLAILAGYALQADGLFLLSVLAWLVNMACQRCWQPMHCKQMVSWCWRCLFETFEFRICFVFRISNFAFLNSRFVPSLDLTS